MPTSTKPAGRRHCSKRMFIISVILKKIFLFIFRPSVGVREEKKILMKNIIRNPYAVANNKPRDATQSQ